MIICLLNSLIYAQRPATILYPDHLLKEGDYQNAEMEYKRYLFHEAKVKQDSVLACEGIAATKYFSRRYTEAANYCDDLIINKEFHSDKIFILSGLSYYRQGYFQSSLIAFGQIQDLKIRNELIVLAYLADQQISQAETILHTIKAESSIALDLNKIVESAKSIKFKSEFLPIVLSAVVPGSGYIYLEHYQTGLSAIMLNGLLIGTAIELGNNGLRLSSGIVYLLSVGWYLGTISGSHQKVLEVNESIYKKNVLSKIDIHLVRFEEKLID